MNTKGLKKIKMAKFEGFRTDVLNGMGGDEKWS
ncbi:MAG: Unknown protein [uncultured Thiotrichaceae bacterium]|uniref:Uncharacterized protein n=1 Tax=uncultured Thiotrichaceae bacterium TaxID=298394 RepID=A0A6S6TLX2_9GAMM|nr:MAG: Unknown protein [uncultured Thiotrichaceae bacterium]